MALFKSKDSGGTATITAPARIASNEPVVGADAAECMHVGQLLVEREQLTAENLASALQQANGDILQFADLVARPLRREAARSSPPRSRRCSSVPLADTKAIELDTQIVGHRRRAASRA